MEIFNIRFWKLTSYAVVKELAAGEALWETKRRKRAEKAQKREEEEQTMAQDARSRQKQANAAAEVTRPSKDGGRRPGFF